MPRTGERYAIPAAVRWGAVAWLAIWVPAYGRTWGAANFLHLCDLAVFLTCAGLFFESALLLSSQAVATPAIALVWVIDAACRVFSGRYLLGGTDYLFDARYPLWVRLLSLFHIAMPIILLWAVRRTGYDWRGWRLQSAIALVAFIASRFTNPALNMNYAFADPFFHRAWGPAPAHIAVIFAFMLLVVYLPTHLLLARWFARKSR